MFDWISYKNQVEASRLTGGIIPHPLVQTLKPRHGFGSLNSPMEVALFGVPDTQKKKEEIVNVTPAGPVEKFIGGVFVAYCALCYVFYIIEKYQDEVVILVFLSISSVAFIINSNKLLSTKSIMGKYPKTSSSLISAIISSLLFYGLIWVNPPEGTIAGPVIAILSNIWSAIAGISSLIWTCLVWSFHNIYYILSGIIGIFVIFFAVCAYMAYAENRKVGAVGVDDTHKT